MRSLGLVVALLVTLSMSAAAQAPGHSRSSPDLRSSNDFANPATPRADTGQTATGNLDPYLERYYSHSEGWTFYNLPPDSTARRSSQ
jgi:hypothetical protein